MSNIKGRDAEYAVEFGIEGEETLGPFRRTISNHFDLEA
jgi:hypothetical protein